MQPYGKDLRHIVETRWSDKEYAEPTSPRRKRVRQALKGRRRASDKRELRRLTQEG